ncbi:Alkaline phosphatase synthesis transcriptional regulatory protein SphR [compost metagenome]|jgi:DNA-binding response OmpR family regulator
MDKKILLVEDDPSTRSMLSFILKGEGFEVVTATDGRAAVHQFEAEPPDLVILDMMLPEKSGFEVSRELRASGRAQKTPIVALTAKGEMTDRFQAFESGVDDFMTKPFDPQELLYRIKALLRLTAKSDDLGPESITAGPLTLYPPRLIVEVEGREVPLTRSEAALLKHFMACPRAVFSAEDLSNTVFPHKNSTTDAVHAHIRNLRAKLEADPKNPTIIVTVGKRGYSFPST